MHNLPHSVVSALFEQFKFMLSHIIKSFARQVSGRLSTLPLSEDVHSILDCDFLIDIFDGIETQHQRQKYAKNNLPYVPPQEHEIPGSSETFQYVPLAPLLERLCELPEVEANLRGHPQISGDSEGTLRTFMDGSLFKEQFQAVIPDGSQCTIFLLLYSDEVEIVNPLGAKRGKHKLLCVYVTLLNIHTKYRSKVRSMHLLVLAKYTCVQKYGLSEILKPLMKDLVELESKGISVVIRDAMQQVQVRAFAFCGDNLSLNRLGGFTCCFSKGKVCRFCLAYKNNLAVLTSEEDCKVRTAAMHQEHLAAIAINSVPCKRMYGVNCSSPLLELSYFDVTSQLPPDAMHEGMWLWKVASSTFSDKFSEAF
ncbi:uncharacterized protein LOC135393978 [Ornithodoros turicata]|uniref:uncharacterized protein LOC135393978 n=1 Tax=Ornithodoros turicata TaxID=34597 RepID=UPI00313862B1